jgi:hypothetical protein
MEKDTTYQISILREGVYGFGPMNSLRYVFGRVGETY